MLFKTFDINDTNGKKDEICDMSEVKSCHTYIWNLKRIFGSEILFQLNAKRFGNQFMCPDI